MCRGVREMNNTHSQRIYGREGVLVRVWQVVLDSFLAVPVQLAEHDLNTQ
jgi:hypothetical protein